MFSESGSSGIVLGNRYEVVGELGRGAMGIVYKAIDRAFQRTVAIKILPQQLASNEEFVARFRREAGALALLEHENIVGFYGFDSQPDGHLLVMEYVDGKSLGTILEEQGPYPPVEAASIAADVASALTAGHRYQIVHRDIKPDNILIERSTGKVKVSDFGIAAVPGSKLTETGITLGTLRYVSPEQIRGADVTTSADIYSLGVVLYEMLAGRPPFIAETPAALFQQHLQDSPPPLRKVASQPIPSELVKIVQSALQKQPHRRFATAEEMAMALRCFTGTETRPRRLRRRVATIVGACVIAAAITVGGIKLLESSSEPSPSPPPTTTATTATSTTTTTPPTATTTASLLLQRAEEFAGQGDWEAARVVADSLLLVFPGSEEAERARTLLAERERTPPPAEPEVDLLATARNDMQRGRYEEALSGLLLFLERNPDADELAEVRYRIGRCYLEQGNSEEAVRSLQAVRAADPGSKYVPPALLAIAESYETTGRDDTARSVLEELVRDHPGSKEAAQARSKLAAWSKGLLVTARSEVQRGDHGAALTTLQGFLASGPDPAEAAEAWYLSGRCEVERKRYESAIRAFEKVGGIDPRSSYLPASLLAIAESYEALGQAEAGARTLERLIRDHPQSAEAQRARQQQDARAEALLESARVAMSRGSYDDALAKLGEYHALGPEPDQMAYAQYMIGECWFAKGDYRRAAEEFAKVERLQPGGDLLPRSLLETARSHEKSGSPDRDKVLEDLIGRFPRSEEAAKAREMLGPEPEEVLENARLAIQRGEHDQARAALRELQRKKPGTELEARALASILQSYREQKNCAMTIETGQELLRDYSAMAWIRDLAHARMARCYYDHGSYDSAIEHGLEVLKNPASDWIEEARFVLGLSYYSTDAYAEAVPHLKAVVSNPASSYAETAYYRLGWSYDQLGDYEKGIRAFRKVVENYRSGSLAPRALLGIADCYGRKGDIEEARKALEEVIRLYPSSGAAETGRKRLREMR